MERILVKVLKNTAGFFFKGQFNSRIHLKSYIKTSECSISYLDTKNWVKNRGNVLNSWREESPSALKIRKSILGFEFLLRLFLILFGSFSTAWVVYLTARIVTFTLSNNDLFTLT